MGISERKEREKSLRKQAILDASVSLFKEKGFLNVTIQDIDADSGFLDFPALPLFFGSMVMIIVVIRRKSKI